MAISEAARNHLYNGLAELLGPERAETLMTYLPSYDPTEVATKTDIREIKTDMRDLRAELNQHFYRLTVTLIAGLFVIVAAMVGIALRGF